jgi:molecular chaperone GrpE
MNRSNEADMGKSNGKPEVETQRLDVEHELPTGEKDEASSASSGGAVAEPAGPESELQKLKAERDSLLDRLARAQAEFENARRRAAKEQQDFRDFAMADAIKSLLPVIDNFERALQSKSEAADFRAGVDLIYKQLRDVLTKLGVQLISAKGQQFDPHIHEAIEMVETPDAADHEVLEEWQRGYKYKDRLLRPAMVKVAKNPGK